MAVTYHGGMRHCALMSDPGEGMLPCKVKQNEEDGGYKMRIVSIKQFEFSRLPSMETETPSDTAMRQSPSCASDESPISLRRLTEIHEDFFRRLAEHQEEFLRSFITTQTEVYQVLNTEMRNNNGKRPFPANEEEDLDKYPDQILVKWLKSHQFPEDNIRKIIRQEFTIQDFRNNVTKEDLKDIGLKVGPRCRLWECISHLQQENVPNGKAVGSGYDSNG